MLTKQKTLDGLLQLNKVQIFKNILLYVILPIVLFCGGLYLVYYLLGNGALFISVIGLYGVSAFISHKKKRTIVKSIADKASDTTSAYDLAVMLRSMHTTAPESIEVTKLIDKLVTVLSVKKL